MGFVYYSTDSFLFWLCFWCKIKSEPFAMINYKIQEKNRKDNKRHSILNQSVIPLYSWTAAAITHSTVPSRRYNLFNGRITYSPIPITCPYANSSIFNTQTHTNIRPAAFHLPRPHEHTHKHIPPRPPGHRTQSREGTAAGVAAGRAEGRDTGEKRSGGRQGVRVSHNARP